MTAVDLAPEKWEAVRDMLVAAGAKMLDTSGSRYVRFSGVPDADDLVNDLAGHPHAFVFACLVDRQVRAELAWQIPLRIRERTGTFAFRELMKLTEQDWIQTLGQPD